MQNLDEYRAKVEAGEEVDWRIKEAFLQAFGAVREQVDEFEELKAQMELMLMRYVLPELDGGQPFLRAAACRAYEVYAELEFVAEDHLNQVIAGLSKNVREQPLPVRYHAACALAKYLAQGFLADQRTEAPDADKKVSLIWCYLSLLNEVENEDLVVAFKAIMCLFADDIRPHALDMFKRMKQSYMECAEKKEGRSASAGVQHFASMRRMLHAFRTDAALLADIEKVIYPCLVHSLTVEGEESAEEGIHCVTLLLYHGYADGEVSAGMWALYPQLVQVAARSQ